jgi:hypothetical protein
MSKLADLEVQRDKCNAEADVLKAKARGFQREIDQIRAAEEAAARVAGMTPAQLAAMKTALGVAEEVAE